MNLFRAASRTRLLLWVSAAAVLFAVVVIYQLIGGDDVECRDWQQSVRARATELRPEEGHLALARAVDELRPARPARCSIPTG